MNPLSPTPLFYGETANFSLKTNAASILTEMKGAINNVDGLLDINPVAGTSSIIIVLATNAIDTDNSSYMEIYTTSALT